MACCEILDEEDVFKITYITMKGWMLEYDGWVKPGITQTVEKYQPCGCCVKLDTSVSNFTLYEAFDKQRYELDEELP